MRTIHVLFVVLASAVLLSAAANANDIRGKLTVSTCDIGGVIDDPAVIESSSVMNGESSLLGKFTAHGRAVALPWDGSSFCSATELEIFYEALPHIFTAANGDTLYTVIADTPPSNVCFNFIDGTFSGTSHLAIVGGTGRFARATGQMTSRWIVEAIVNSAGVSYCQAGEGEMEGEIILERP